MKKNEKKNTFMKLKPKESQIKVKKKSDNNLISTKINNKSNKFKESLFPRTSFNTNTDFFSGMDLISKSSSNKNEYNTIIQSKKLSLNIKNKINDFGKINYKYYTNRKNGNQINYKEGKKLNILKDKSKENISNNILKETKSIRQSLNNNNKLPKNKLDNNNKILDINLFSQKTNNSYEKIKKLIESSTLTINNQAKRNHKKIKQNHSNLISFEQIKNKENIAPLNIKEIYNIQKKILPIKKNNSSTNSKHIKNGNNSNNSYNSCYNFYQNTSNIHNNINKNNYNYNRMLNTINNFEFHNYSNIYKIEENLTEKNRIKNKKFIPFEKENIDINDLKSKCITQSKNSVQTSDIKVSNRTSIFNKKKELILNKILNRDNKKLIEYQKKLIQYFCKSIEDFIYISVKNKFNDFISNLKKFSIEKNSHYLLLKRLQNKSIHKNFFKDKEKTFFYKYSAKDENSSNYSQNIMMNNSNIINYQKNEKDFKNGYFGNIKNISHLNKIQSPNLNDNFEKRHKYFNSTIYSNKLNSYDLLWKDNKENYNCINLKRNILFNNNNDSHGKISETNYEKSNNNNIYIPKKLKLTNKSQYTNYNNNSYILNPYIINNLSLNTITKKINNQNKKCNQSHELNNNSIKAKLAIKKYGSNDDFYNMQNITNNINNSKLNTYKENLDFLNKTNDKIKNRNNHIIPGKTFDTEFNERNSIYIKNLKIYNSSNMYSKPKLSKIRNQILGINLNLKNNNNNTNNIIGQYLSPNIEKNINQNLIINSNNNEFKNIPLSMINPNHFRITYTEPRRETDLDINNNHNKFGNIQELTVNLSKKRNNGINQIYKKENIFIYSQNDFDNCRVKEYKINENQNSSYNELNGDKNVTNEADIENEEFPLKEIIIKDVSSSDNRLNVFIKYLEIPNMNKIFQRKSIYYNINLLKYFHIDSFYIPASYQKLIPSNIYYKNYCLGNKILNNNKIKFNKILSSIIEEEEKSKAAGSVNNSLSSDEEINKNINNNYSHYFIQSIKYISNLLQSIFDDKKKDSFNKFFKILKKIKNEAFLQGIIKEKNSETLNKTKNEKKDNKEEINIDNKEDKNTESKE